MHPSTSSSNIEVTIQRALLILGLMLGAIFLAVQGIRTQQPLVMVLVVAIPIGIYFFTRPNKMMLGLFIANAGAIMLPGVRASFTLGHIFMAMIIAWVVATVAMGRSRNVRLRTSDKIMLLFVANVLLIMGVRGFSLAIFGGYEMGGMAYIQLLLGFLILLAGDRIYLRKNDVKWLVLGVLLARFLPVAVELAIWITRGRLYFLTNYIDVAAGYLVRGMQAEDPGAARWGAFSHLGMSVAILGLVIFSYWGGRRRVVLPALCVLAAIPMIAVSGFRSRFVQLVVVVVIWMFIMSRNRQRLLMQFAVLGLVGWLAIIVFSPVMPRNVQRTVSFVPFVRVPEEVSRQAWGTVTGRTEIWKHAWRNVPQYLFVGRGMVVDVQEFAWLPMRYYHAHPEFAYLMHSYHSGPLTLLVDFGIPGLFLGTLLIFSLVRESWKGIKVFQDRTTIGYRYYIYGVAYLTYQAFGFYFVYGAIKTIVAMIITATLMRAILYSEKVKNKSNLEESYS